MLFLWVGSSGVLSFPSTSSFLVPMRQFFLSHFPFLCYHFDVRPCCSLPVLRHHVYTQSLLFPNVSYSYHFAHFISAFCPQPNKPNRLPHALNLSFALSILVLTSVLPYLLFLLPSPPYPSVSHLLSSILLNSSLFPLIHAATSSLPSLHIFLSF